jgi:hypothetical protein
VSPVDRRLKEPVNEVATEYLFVVHEMEVMPDHLHPFVAADPTRSVAEIVSRCRLAEPVRLRRHGRCRPRAGYLSPPARIEVSPGFVEVPPPRPRSCGQYRYRNGEYCADARYERP